MMNDNIAHGIVCVLSPSFNYSFIWLQQTLHYWKMVVPTWWI